MFEKVFKLSEHQTTVKTEVMAGITTFMTMAYILAVNPNILSSTGMDHGAVFTATALAAFLGTLLMALFANYPFALAPGMGLNAYFAYTVVLGSQPKMGLMTRGGLSSSMLPFSSHMAMSFTYWACSRGLSSGSGSTSSSRRSFSKKALS